MMGFTSVSVVMSVHDNAAHVRATLDSVLAQQDVEFEVIVIDDGAEESVKQTLEEYNSDPRLLILTQPREGLTKALIRGCNQARFPCVARIDAGDKMLPGRLAAQAQLLQDQPQVGLVTSWVDVVTEEGYALYQIRQRAEDLRSAMLTSNPELLSSPFHASVMFRKAIYEQVGGYRAEFYFTQDCDLWARMAAQSGIDVIAKTLTVGLFSPHGLSGRYLAYQRQLKELVAAANRLRSEGKPDDPVLLEAEKHRPKCKATSSETTVNDKSDFASLYFIARCLSKKRSPHASEYWRRVLTCRPWSLPSWYFYLCSIPFK